EGNETKKIPSPSIEHAHQHTKNRFRQLTSHAEAETDNLEKEAQHVSEILKRSKQKEDQADINNSDIVVASSISPHTLVETGLTSHRGMKSGSQRFRWNLLFNLLLWLIVPLPFWIPFVSNRLAYYLLPSIQGVFVLMWTSKCTHLCPSYF
ncbi:unnamed protein product, partial [Didymodactylos carnosus]